MKKLSIILSVLALGFLSFKTVDDYFEVSKNLEIFTSVYKEVNTAYVDEVKPGELVRHAIDGMLNSLDPYTNFYSEAQKEDYLYQVTGTYAGIGTSVKYIDNKVVIDEPHEGYPAHDAGLLPGDIVIAIDDQDTKDKSIKEVIDLMHGNAGTGLKLKVNRPGKGEMQFTIIREKIKLPNVPYAGMLENNIGYLKLVSFTPGAGNEVRNAVSDLKGKGAKSIVLDLRGNGGGLLHEAVNIVNVFVKKGELIVSTKGKHVEENLYYKTLNSPLDTEIPLAVIIDDHSASASEIVAGSLQDLDRAILIGRNSFGKGLVQSTKSLTYNTQMKITIAKYYIPSGRLIQRLDYGNKVNGRAVAVADSLKNTFYTRNGRPVIDGEGIFPDIEVELEDRSKITQSLIRNNLIFDFATQYRNEHESIAPPMQYDVDEALFQEFVAFLSDKEYEYTTNTEKLVDELKVKAKEERYNEDLLSEIEQLDAQVKAQKSNDLTQYKEEIKELLEYEIARRYYFDKGMVEISFDDDEDLAHAIEVLSDLTKLSSLLGNS
ncbi:PDZ domain-containing protein [bacterium]|nr:PDZ domain-containing protein [bacterium]